MNAPLQYSRFPKRFLQRLRQQSPIRRAALPAAGSAHLSASARRPEAKADGWASPSSHSRPAPRRARKDRETERASACGHRRPRTVLTEHLADQFLLHKRNVPLTGLTATTNNTPITTRWRKKQQPLVFFCAGDSTTRNPTGRWLFSSRSGRTAQPHNSPRLQPPSRQQHAGHRRVRSRQQPSPYSRLRPHDGAEESRPRLRPGGAVRPRQPRGGAMPPHPPGSRHLLRHRRLPPRAAPAHQVLGVLVHVGHAAPVLLVNEQHVPHPQQHQRRQSPVQHRRHSGQPPAGPPHGAPPRWAAKRRGGRLSSRAVRAQTRRGGAGTAREAERAAAILRRAGAGPALPHGSARGGAAAPAVIGSSGRAAAAAFRSVPPVGEPPSRHRGSGAASRSLNETPSEHRPRAEYLRVPLLWINKQNVLRFSDSICTIFICKNNHLNAYQV